MSPTKALAVLLSIAAVVAAYVTFGRLTSTVPTGSIATVPVVQVDFLRTRTNLESGAVDLIYRGVRYLADAADGRMRVDRTPVDNSEGPTSVLFLPTRRQPGFNPGRRIELNHSTKQATVSATQFYWPFPSTPGEPQPETAVEPDSEPLGVRYLGPLRLKTTAKDLHPSCSCRPDVSQASIQAAGSSSTTPRSRPPSARLNSTGRFQVLPVNRSRRRRWSPIPSRLACATSGHWPKGISEFRRRHGGGIVVSRELTEDSGNRRTHQRRARHDPDRSHGGPKQADPRVAL